MLIITKKYEAIEVSVYKSALLLIVTIIAVAFLTGIVTNIPNNINIAISIPISLLTTVIWEFTIKKSNRVYDEAGIERLLSKIAEADSIFVFNFVTKFLKARAKSKAVLHINKSTLLDEVDLLVCFFQSSFPELKYEVIEPEYVIALCNKLLAKPSPLILEAEYGVNFSNLAFLYECNNRYFFNNYLIHKPIELSYILKNQKLLIEQSLIDVQVFDGELITEFKDNVYKNKYFDVLEAHHKFCINLLKDNISISSNDWKSHLQKQIQLFDQITVMPEFDTLTLNLAYDIIFSIFVYSFYISNPTDSRAFDYENFQFQEVLQKMEDRISTHPVVNFFYLSVYKSISVYLKNNEDFKFSYIYNRLIHQTFRNEFNKRIATLRFAEFAELFMVYKSLNLGRVEDGEFWTLVYQKFSDFYYFQKPLEFHDLPIVIDAEGASEAYVNTTKMKMQRVLTQLNQLEHSSLEAKEEILRKVFTFNFDLIFFHSIPLYHYQDFTKFADYCRSE